ncbi:hypothetical protein M011DRAFT_468991 [Sporormia fimetaria CBS 119925]|uniref:Uncharacterized protein n=1 Tax=Sporormia fimetaria CBS 119925 TaxID=1340428 RepID=A0A6A6VA16_9PLEO|nr:hypothetical protein M011DRAFT_468991 [Sporormia fimetaria CBS 119925]
MPRTTSQSPGPVASASAAPTSLPSSQKAVKKKATTMSKDASTKAKPVVRRDSGNAENDKIVTGGVKHTPKKLVSETKKPVPANTTTTAPTAASKPTTSTHAPAKLPETKKTAVKPPSSSSTTTTTKDISQSTTTAPTAPTDSQPRQRRRPRKLTREDATKSTIELEQTTAATLDSASSTLPPSEPTQNAITSAAIVIETTNELEALKSRVRGLEAKVEELYKAGSANSSTGNGSGAGRARSPRRRGKGRKGSNTTVISPTEIPDAERVQEVLDDEGEVVEMGEESEELRRAETELALARRDLETYQGGGGGRRGRPSNRRNRSSQDEGIEEIPRAGEPGLLDSETLHMDRQVTLTGSYRIPLPATVSMDDVKNLQSGVSAAQNVARSFLEQRRARQRAELRERGVEEEKPVVKREGSGEGKQSWGEWFGGYSMAISRAVKNIEAEAAVESAPVNSTARKAGKTGGTAGSRNTSGKAGVGGGKRQKGTAKGS